MNALVLAAGFGTRLKPWTEEYAKPLIPVAGVEALFFAIFRLHQAGIKNIFVNAHYKAEQLRGALKTFAALFPDTNFKLSLEKTILGTGGAILKLLEEEDLSEGLLVLNGDTLASFDCQKLLNGDSSFAVSFEKSYFKKYKALFVDELGAWSEKVAELEAHFLGAHYLSPEALDLLQTKSLRVREVDLFSGIYAVLKRHELFCYAVDVLENSADKKDFWFDLNTKEYLIEARDQLSGPFVGYWQEILKKRHPSLSLKEALSYWPLASDPSGI